MAKPKRNIDPVTDSRYLVEAAYITDRLADYETAEELREVFKPITASMARELGQDSLNGNVSSYCMVEEKTRKAKFLKDYRKEGFVGLYKAIPASLAMYRLICMFENPIVNTIGAAGYKMPWNMYFKHKSGTVIMFGEWKGAFGFWTAALEEKTLKPEFKKDIIKLLNLMLSNNSPHPYDHTVAGTCA